MIRSIGILTAIICIAGSVFAEGLPQNAIVLFDGKDLSKWASRKDGSEAKWKLVGDRAMEVNGTGDIVTKDKFQDFTLHVEFMTPSMPDKHGQARGNSGVYLQDRYEVQVLDSFGLESKDDDCGAVYKEKAPAVNACKPPEQWQTYDITFKAAKFDASGKKVEGPHVTVIQNGQKIIDNFECTGPTGAGAPEGAEPGPIRLQDHGGNPVRYRNIWIVPGGDTSKDGK
jgi:hypothetical protein